MVMVVMVVVVNVPSNFLKYVCAKNIFLCNILPELIGIWNDGYEKYLCAIEGILVVDRILG